MNDQSIRETNRSRSDPGFFFLINIIRVNSPLLAAEEPSVYNSIIYGRTDQEDVRKRIYTYIAQCK